MLYTRRLSVIIAAALLPLAGLAAGDGERAEWRFDKPGPDSPQSVTSLSPTNGGPAAIKFVHREDAGSGFSIAGGNPKKKVSHYGDYWLFEMPVKNLEKGTAVDFWLAFVAEPADTRYKFALEYLDGKKWLPVTPLHKGCNFTSTGKSKFPQRAWQTVRLSKPIDNGTVQFRLRQCEKAELTTSLYGSRNGQGPQIVCYDASIPKDTLRILFIGNSYTYHNNYPVIFKEMAWREGHYADCSIFVSGGYTMRMHLDNEFSREKVAAGGYDYAMIQDQSFRAVLNGTEDDRGGQKDMQEMIAAVRAASPSVRTVIEITWGRKFGGNALGKKYEYLKDKYPQYFGSYEAMQERLIDQLSKEAATTGSGVSPVGVAWRIVRSERPDIELYGRDAHHPSYAGSYLSAAVAYLTIYATPFGPKPIDGQLPADVAAYLRSVAERVVLGGENMAR